jgi:hypothetical protein
MSSQQSTDDCILVDTSSLALQLLEESQESPFDESLIDPALLPTIHSDTPSRACSQPPDRLNAPDIATYSSARQSTLRWTHEMQEALLVTLLDQCRAGKRADSGFKKEAWVAVLVAVQAITTSPINEKQAKSRIDWFKSMWKEWCALEDNSGFGWDEPTQLFTAEDSVWKEYLKVSSQYYY